MSMGMSPVPMGKEITPSVDGGDMAKIRFQGRDIEVPAGTTIESAVVSEGLHPDSYLYLIDGKPVPMDTEVPEDAEVRAVRVASGG